MAIKRNKIGSTVDKHEPVFGGKMNTPPLKNRKNFYSFLEATVKMASYIQMHITLAIIRIYILHIRSYFFINCIKFGSDSNSNE